MRCGNMPSVSFSFCLVLLVCLSISSGVRADIGTVQVQPESISAELAESENQSDGSSLSSESAPAVESLQTLAASEEGVNRPWMLNTVAGPTAFVLDSRQFEIGIPLNRFSQLVWAESGSSRPYLHANYGLTDSVSLSVGGSQSTVSGGVKWNFWNGEAWSFSLNPWVGYQFRQPNNYFSQNISKKIPVGIALAASRVIDGRHKTHFSLELARSSIDSSLSYSYPNFAGAPDSSVHSRSVIQQVDARIAAAYELRLNRRHGVSFWVAPAISRIDTESSHFGTDLPASINKWDDTLIQVEAGVGYQYFLDHFGFEIGIAAGPQWSSYRSSEIYNYTDKSIAGSITGGLSYRL